MRYKKIVLLVSSLIILGGLFVSGISTAKATTATMSTDEMIALIQKLQQQIADLQKQLAQAQGTQTAWCHDFYKNLSAGTNNEEVASLHTVLEKEGFDIFDEEKANKEFGESTASAISGFQQKYANEILTPLGLRYGTGILGKSTRTKLNKLFGCNVKATPRPFCSPISATCEASSAKIVCPAGLDDKGCPFPCKCVPVACTQEAKICPDGTSVSRIAPTCEFAPCPNQTTNQTPSIYGIGGPTFLKVNEGGTWTVKASDRERKGLVYSVLWGDGSELQSQKSTTNAEIAVFTHSFSKAGAYNLTFSVTDEQGLATKMGVTVKVEETISSLVVSEQVKCLFKGSQTEQKCNASSDGYSGYGCSGKEGCVVDIKGKQGDKITWKSSCGGYAYTTMDSQNEYAEFNCAAVPVPVTPPITVNPTETGVGVYRFEILDSAASCQACPVGTACTPSPCLPASTYIIYFAKVSVYDEKGNFIASKDTSSGMAVFDNLPYGNYVAYFSANGYQEDKISFTVGSNFPTNNTSMLKKIAAQTTTQTANKSITVVSPNGGERLLKGATYAIKWNSANVASVYIKLRKGSDTYNGPEGEASKIINNSGIFFWTVPTTLQDGSDYAIRIVDGTATVLDDSESFFSIASSAASNTQPIVARTCPELYTLQRYYFDSCQKQGYDNVCFNKFTILYQGCVKSANNDCTQSNVNAERNVLCSITGGAAVLATPIPTTPIPTTPPTTVVKDTTPPSTPFNLTATSLSSTPTAVGLSWAESKDNVAVVGYSLYRDGALLTSAITTGSYRDTNLSPGATYTYTVSAFDAAGNYSGKSSSASVIVPVETTPPVISSINVAEITANSAIITWTTDEAADSTVEYGLTASADTASGYNNAVGENIFLTSHRMHLGSLQANTLYHYRVKSKDSWGNLAVSGDNTFTTAAAPVFPIQVISIDGAQVEVGKTFYITWQHSSEFAGKTIAVDISVLSADSSGNYTVPKLDIVKGYKTEVLGAVPGKSEYGWQVPSDLTPGDYKVKICEYDPNNSAVVKCDETDKPFKVIASTTSQTDSLNQLANVLTAIQATLDKASEYIANRLKNQ